MSNASVPQPRRSLDPAVVAYDLLSARRHRYGGKLGFKWLIPDVSTFDGEEPPHVIVWLNTASPRRHAIGYGIHPAKSASSELADLCDAAWSATEQQLRSAGHVGTIRDRSEFRKADFSSDEAINATVREALPRVRLAYQELLRELSHWGDGTPEE